MIASDIGWRPLSSNTFGGTLCESDPIIQVEAWKFENRFLTV